MYQFKLHTPRGFTNILLVFTLITSALSAQTPAPSDIYVGNGYRSGEYYDFFTDQAGTNKINISDYTFYRGNTYTFHKIRYRGHPFYLSDVPLSSGSYHLGTLTLDVESNANQAALVAYCQARACLSPSPSLTANNFIITAQYLFILIWSHRSMLVMPEDDSLNSPV